MGRPKKPGKPSPQAAYMRKLRETSPEWRAKEAARMKAYCATPEEKARRSKYMREWSKDPSNYWKKLRNTRKWYARHKEERRKSVKASYDKLRLECLVRYSQDPPTCSCCGETQVIFLTLDHIDGNGAAHRRSIGLCGVTNPKGTKTAFQYWLKRNDFPDGFQVLCWNCNWAKSHGGCPHQKVKESVE